MQINLKKFVTVLELNCRLEISPELLDLLGTSLGLGLVLGLVQGDLSVSLDQLPLQVQASLCLLLQLHTHRLQLDLNLAQTRLQQGAPLNTTTQLSTNTQLRVDGRTISGRIKVWIIQR